MIIKAKNYWAQFPSSSIDIDIDIFGITLFEFYMVIGKLRKQVEIVILNFVIGVYFD